MVTQIRGPVSNLDAHLRSIGKKHKGTRDRLLQNLQAPSWMLSSSQDSTLGEVSLGVVSVACALASPLGVDETHLVEVAQVVRGLEGADASYLFEMRRYARMLDTVLRLWLPGWLSHLQRKDQAALFVDLPRLDNVDAIHQAYGAALQTARDLGSATALANNVRNLQDAACVQAIGFAMSATKYFVDALDNLFLPSETIPPLRSFYNSVPLFLWAVRIAEGAPAVNRTGVQLLRELIAAPETILQPEMAKLTQALQTLLPSKSN